MAEEQSSAEVAEDYRLALEDLNSINRADISTLTTIARENTEHAQAITEALQKHIIKTPAHKKLPAIYVLDSIVKNVGTPYTLFFGAQLYKTFMEAYLAVDGHVRRKMEETLRTWKQPVPQSLDDRPVFPPDVTGPIEEALNIARSSAMALQQQQASRSGFPGRPRGIANDRATPTPPGMRSGPGYPNHMQQANGSRPASAQPYPPHSTASPYPPNNAYAGQPPSGPWQPPGQMPPGAGPGAYQQAPARVDIGALNRDIEDVINSSRLEADRNPLDQGVQQRLKGLLDLKNLLQIQSVSQEQLVLIKKQVADLAVKVRPYSAPPAAVAPVVPPPASSSGPASQPGSVTLDSLFGQGALSALLGRQSATPQVPTPTPPSLGALLSNVPIRSPQPPAAQPARQASAAPASNPLALLEGLRKAGLLSGTPPAATPSAPPVINRPPPSMPQGMPLGIPPGIPPPGVGAPPGFLPPNLASLLGPLKTTGLSISGQIMDTIQLTAASLKNEIRPHLFPTMYEALGPQCTQCGRRFTQDEDGRRKKTAHMDWHFQVHHRLVEAERRGQHRSWYVDGADWVRTREAVDADHAHDEPGGGGAGGQDGAGGAGGRGAPEVKYMAVPDASAGVNTTCPICQEKFENKWLDTAQEWVWLDAMLVGGRAYHISCHAEATQARDSTPARGTPEPVLGKRKAEDELKNLRKVKMDNF